MTRQRSNTARQTSDATTTVTVLAIGLLTLAMLPAASFAAPGALNPIRIALAHTPVAADADSDASRIGGSPAFPAASASARPTSDGAPPRRVAAYACHNRPPPTRA